MNNEKEKLYTRAELVTAVRDLTEDARMGEALFTEAVATWLANMLDGEPGLPLKAANRIEKLVTSIAEENGASHRQREHARRLAIGVRVSVARKSSPSD